MKKKVARMILIMGIGLMEIVIDIETSIATFNSIEYVKGEDKKGANANAPRDIHDRLKIELTKLYKAVRNDDNADTEALASANWHIGAALTAIGVDLSDLNIEG